MKRFSILALPLLAVMLLAVSPPDAESQVFLFKKSLYGARVVDATADSATVAVNIRNIGAPGFEYALPDSVKLVRVVKGDSVKFESRILYKAYGSSSTTFKFSTTAVDTITRANVSGASTYDSTVVATLTAANWKDKEYVAVKIKGLTGNATLSANANYVQAFLEFFYHK